MFDMEFEAVGCGDVVIKLCTKVGKFSSKSICRCTYGTLLQKPIIVT
jgi:hypothetical protein